MTWRDLLKKEMDRTYAAAQGLLDLVDNDNLDWKPESGDNWMTMGQLLMHVATACGQPCKGFVTGDWGLPEGKSVEEMSPEEMIPPADKLPAAESVDQAREAIIKDKQLAVDMIAQAGEERLANESVTAPWDPMPHPLGYMMLQMVQHLAIHKAQLFYYLKLQGKPVNTGHLWGGGV